MPNTAPPPVDQHKRKYSTGRILLRASPVLCFLLLGPIGFDREDTNRLAWWLAVFAAMIILSIFAASSFAIEWSQRVEQRWLPSISIFSAWIAVAAVFGSAIDYGFGASAQDSEADPLSSNLTLVLVGLCLVGICASGVVAIFSAVRAKSSPEHLTI